MDGHIQEFRRHGHVIVSLCVWGVLRIIEIKVRQADLEPHLKA